MAEIDLSAFSNVVPLGSGGLGDVYRAVRRSTGGEVAIKVLRDWSDSDTAWQRTQRELRALVHLKGHGNVVNIEEVIETDGAMAIVMEYAPGGAVSDLLRERGTLGFADVLLIAAQTAAALSASHDRGIIHRDIKPHNLLIDAFGQVKVCDFGIAALTRSDEVSNRTSALSLRYASPEELRGDPDIGPAADVYSLAATVHQLLTGQYLPIPDGTPESAPLLGWTSPPEVPSHVAEAFRSLITQAADRTASARPTAAALHDQLDILSGQLGPLRSRALPLATPELDDATQVRSVSITGPTDTEPPPDVQAPAPPAPLTDAHTVIHAEAVQEGATPPPDTGGEASAAALTEQGETDPQRRPRALVAAIAVAVLGLGAVLVLNVLGGDDTVTAPADDQGERAAETTTSTAAPTTTSAPTTTAAETTTTTVATTTTTTTTTTLPPDAPVCPGDGHCIVFTGIFEDVDPTTGELEQRIQWQSNVDWRTLERAIFFWDIYSVDQVGTGVDNPAPYTSNSPNGVWQPEDFREIHRENRPEGATGLCVTAADFDNVVLDPSYVHCVPLDEAGTWAASQEIQAFAEQLLAQRWETYGRPTGELTDEDIALAQTIAARYP